MKQLTISLIFCVFAFSHSIGQDGMERSPSHIIKLNLAPILVGEIMPSYEFIFHDKLSLEGGIGFLTENYLQNFIQESNSSKTRQIKFGPCLYTGIRYYPYKKGEIIYLSAQVRYRKYKEVYQQLDGSGSLTEIEEYLQRVFPRVGIGYHVYLDDHFLIDLSAHMGLVFDKRFQFGYIEPVKNTGLHFGMGIKFAYAF